MKLLAPLRLTELKLRLTSNNKNIISVFQNIYHKDTFAGLR